MKRILAAAAVAVLLLCATAFAAPASAPSAAQDKTAPDTARGEKTPAVAAPVTQPAAQPAEREGTSFLDTPDTPDAPGSALPNVGVTLVRLLGAMLLIVAILVGGVLLFKRFAKRAMNFSRGGNSPLRLVERLPLGPKNQVCLIQACGRYLVLGVSEKDINVLMEVTLPGEENAGADFAALLSQSGEKLQGRRAN